MRRRINLHLGLLLCAGLASCQATSGAIEPARLAAVTRLDKVQLLSIQSRGRLNLNVTGDSAQIEAEAGAGLEFQFRLNPETTYRLKWKGSPSGSPPVLRLGYRGLRYYAPADSSFAVTLPGMLSSLELLLYSESEIHYRLQLLELKECRDCFGDRELRTKLLSDIPQLGRQLKTDRLAAAQSLLDWVANAGDYAVGSKLLMDESVTAFASASDIFHDRFSRNERGVYCGGYAQFYDKVLKLFDYPSFTFDFGRQSAGLTHVTVVVPHQEPRGWRFYLFDPTFNLVFVDARGNYASLDQIILGPLSGFHVKSFPLDRRDFLVVPQNRYFCTEIKERKDDFLVCSHPDYGIDYYFKVYRETYEAQGLDSGLAGFVQLMRERVYSLGPTLNPEPQRELERLLEAAKIQVGNPR